METIFKKITQRKNKDVSIIVEISGNHQNSYKKLEKFINNIVKNKINIVKFQVYKPETITIKSNKKDFKIPKNNPWSKHLNLFDLYGQAHTPWNWIEKLTKILNKKKINWFASVFDETSIKFLENLDCKAYKIASPEINDINLIRAVSKTKKPIFLSTGMATINDIVIAVKTIKKFHNNFAILKCTSKYPTKLNELNLGSINYLKKKFKCAVGFSDHTIGSAGAIAAVLNGATIIEKHFKLDNDKKSIDQHFSMNLSNYKNFKHNLSNIRYSLGKNNEKAFILDKKIFNTRRSIYVSSEIKKGELFLDSNIKSVRPGFSLEPKYLNNFINKRSRINLKIGSRLKLNFIKKIGK
jgi:N-acetylneuraminate synthase/pseudaminic acid synthase